VSDPPVSDPPPSDPPSGVRTYTTQRMEAFSDGVFAIAITLLVLDLAVPLGSQKDLLAAVGHQWPSYVAYVVSFATIGALWTGHNAITEYLQRADYVFIRINLFLLLLVSFLPFPTRLLSEYIHARHAEEVAVTFYGLTLFAAAAVLSLLWRYALSRHLERPEAGDEELTELTERLTPGLAGYVILLVLGVFVPLAAVIGYLAVALFFILPVRIRRKRSTPL
jgi:uncharacterized membrane protein